MDINGEHKLEHKFANSVKNTERGLRLNAYSSVFGKSSADSVVLKKVTDVPSEFTFGFVFYEETKNPFDKNKPFICIYISPKTKLRVYFEKEIRVTIESTEKRCSKKIRRNNIEIAPASKGWNYFGISISAEETSISATFLLKSGTKKIQKASLLLKKVCFEASPHTELEFFSYSESTILNRMTLFDLLMTEAEFDSFIESTVSPICEPGLIENMVEGDESFECIEECPSQFFSKNGRCKSIKLRICNEIECHESCQQCTSEDETSCLECMPDFYRVFLDRESSICMHSCLNKTYHLGLDEIKCKKCGDTCECTTTDECISYCPNGLKFINGDKIECVLKCPKRYFANVNENICQKCAEGCEECKGPSIMDCKKCQNDRFTLPNPLKNSRVLCLNQCPQFFYPDLSDRKCKKCIAPCKTCKSQTECLSCMDDYLAYTTDNLSFECSKCPKRFYFDEKLNGCAQCHKSCQDCTGPAQTQCIRCKANYNSFMMDREDQQEKLICLAEGDISKLYTQSKEILLRNSKN